jgi:GNAT superfamily N-acetyltransferase
MRGIDIRPAGAADRPQILALLRESLGWAGDDRHDRLFAWKHLENPFGASPSWVATASGRVIGLRVFMRWEFEIGSRIVPALRAVDTATASEYRGRGVFRALTSCALGELAGVAAFVFNTPNDASLPGYRSLGWEVVGRVPVGFHPRGTRGIARAGRARTPAQRWSEPSSAGLPAADVLAHADRLVPLLATRGRPRGARTHVTPQYLRWRYGGELIGYRAVLAGVDVDDGVALVRVRRRGPAREAVLCEVLVHEDDATASAALVRRAVRAVEADYVLADRRRGRSRLGFVPLPRAGPLLVARGLGEASPPAAWDLRLGDLELF